MRHAFLGSFAVVGVLISMPQQRADAQRQREPTLDDQFRNQAPAELPLVNPPQSKQVTEKQAVANTSGPAYLGVTFATENQGAVVRTVTPGSPAEQAGLQPQDVIESLQGIVIDSPQDVLDLVAKMRPGTMLDIGVSRRVSVRAQAPLASLPAGTSRRVNYPPDTTTQHELLPVPVNAPRNISTSGTQPSRYTAPQIRSGSASGQPRNYNQNQNSRAPDNNRGILGRRRG